MKKVIEEGLDYTLKTDEMLQMNAVMLSNFEIDKADFIAKVPDLDSPFSGNWLIDTNKLSATESDADFIDTQLLKTQAIEELMVTGRDILQSVYFYVERAFPGNKAVLSYFGKDRYEASRNIPLKLAEIINKCREACLESDYKDILITKGLTDQLVVDLKENAVKITEKVTNRDIYMSNRKINTQNRNQQLNKIWSYMSVVNEASKLVYKSDYAKLQQYILYKATVIDNKSSIASEDEIAN
jgi:hypothetical protein